MKKPVIGITMGDPAGVGPELCLRALADRRVRAACHPVIFGDAAVLARVAAICRLPAPPAAIPVEDWFRARGAAETPLVVDCRAIVAGSVKPGRVNAACGSAACRYIEAAVNAAMTGRIAAMATAPINKESLHLAGIRHPGHTEILADLTRARRVCMMMAADDIKVCLVTIHTSLASVPRLVTGRKIMDAIELSHDAVRRLGRENPCIAVCALNPHGGENGMFGSEEKRIIVPAIRQARKRGWNVIGPVVPDTAFIPSMRRKVDAYVVMYHDQGLIPFKMLAFDRGANISLGLPVIRTSVDHGTAFDIAWQGKALPGSLVQSILWETRLSRKPGAKQ